MSAPRLLVVAGTNPVSVANSIITWAPHIERVGLLCSTDKGVSDTEQRIKDWLETGELKNQKKQTNIFMTAPLNGEGKRIQCERIEIPRLAELPEKNIMINDLNQHDVIDCRCGTKLHGVRLVNAAMAEPEFSRPKICTTNAHEGTVRCLEPLKAVYSPAPRSLDIGSILFLHHGKIPEGFKPPPLAHSDQWVKDGESGQFKAFHKESELDENVNLLPRPIREHYTPLFDLEHVTKLEGRRNPYNIEVKILGNKFEAVVVSMITAWSKSRGLNDEDTEIWANLEWHVSGDEDSDSFRETDIILRVRRKLALVSIKSRIIKDTTLEWKMNAKKKDTLKEIARFRGESRIVSAFPRDMRQVFVVTNFGLDGKDIDSARQLGVRLCNPETFWDELDTTFDVTMDESE